MKERKEAEGVSNTDKDNTEVVVNWVCRCISPHSQANNMTAVPELFCSLSVTPGKLKMATFSPEEVLAVCHGLRMILVRQRN